MDGHNPDKKPKDNQTLSVWDATTQAEKDFQIPDGLLRGLGMEESHGLNHWDEKGNLIKSGTGPTGAFQFTLKTAKSYNVNRDNPLDNIIGAAKYLQDNYKALRSQVDDDHEAWIAAAIAHNRGLGAVQGMIKNRRFEPAGKDSGNGGDTRAYATRILNNWAKLRGGNAQTAQNPQNGITGDTTTQPPIQNPDQHIAPVETDTLDELTKQKAILEQDLKRAAAMRDKLKIKKSLNLLNQTIAEETAKRGTNQTNPATLPPANDPPVGTTRRFDTLTPFGFEAPPSQTLKDGTVITLDQNRENLQNNEFRYVTKDGRRIKMSVGHPDEQGSYTSSFTADGGDQAAPKRDILELGENGGDPQFVEQDNQEGLKPGQIRMVDVRDGSDVIAKAVTGKDGKTSYQLFKEGGADQTPVRKNAAQKSGVRVPKTQKTSTGIGETKPFAETAAQFNFERSGQLKLQTGESLSYLPNNRDGLKEGEYRFADKDGNNFILNPETDDLRNESLDVLEKVTVPLLPKSATYTKELAVTTQAGQIAESIAGKYQIPKEDIVDFYQGFGFTDLETGEQLPEERLFAKTSLVGLTPENQTDFVNITKGDIKRIKEFSEQKKLKIAEYEANKAELIKQGNDDYEAANLAQKQMGLGNADADKELENYRAEKRKLTDFYRSFPEALGQGTPNEAAAEEVIKQDLQRTLKTYGSISAKIAEEEKWNALSFEDKSREVAIALARTVPKALASIYKTAGAAESLISRFDKLYKPYDTDQSFFYKLGDIAEDFTDHYLPQKPEARNRFIVIAGDSIGQVGSMAAAAALTGGISLPSVMGLSQGFASQYDEAKEEGATENQRLLSGVVGALAAAPDILITRGWFKFLTKTEKVGLLNSIARSTFRRLAGEIGEAEAENITRTGFQKLLQRVGQLGEKHFGAEVVKEAEKFTIKGALKTGAKGTALEGLQESPTEDTINEAGARLIYGRNSIDGKKQKPLGMVSSVGDAFKRLVYGSNNEGSAFTFNLESFVGGGIGGAFGGMVEVVTGHLNAKNYEAATAEIEDAIKRQIVDRTQGEKLKQAVNLAAEETTETPEISDVENAAQTPVVEGKTDDLKEGEKTENSEISQKSDVQENEQGVYENVQANEPKPVKTSKTDVQENEQGGQDVDKPKTLEVGAKVDAKGKGIGTLTKFLGNKATVEIKNPDGTTKVVIARLNTLTPIADVLGETSGGATPETTPDPVRISGIKGKPGAAQGFTFGGNDKMSSFDDNSAQKNDSLAENKKPAQNEINKKLLELGELQTKAVKFGAKSLDVVEMSKVHSLFDALEKETKLTKAAIAEEADKVFKESVKLKTGENLNTTENNVKEIEKLTHKKNNLNSKNTIKAVKFENGKVVDEQEIPHDIMREFLAQEYEKQFGRSEIEGKTEKNITPPKIAKPLSLNQNTSLLHKENQQTPAKDENSPEEKPAPSHKVLTPTGAFPKSAVTQSGTRVNYRPKVIDASDILTSFETGYPQEFQPRKTDRAASKAKISKNAAQLDVTQMDDAATAGDGAPKVVPVEVTIGGKTVIKYAAITRNHGVESIREANRTYPEKAKEYASFAKSKDQNSTAKNPVYVHELDSSTIDDLRKFAIDANVGSQRKMSDVEQATVDASLISSGLMEKFQPAENGSIHSGANRDFIRGFLQTVVDENEHGAMQTESGELSQTGIRRITNAIFARAFGSSKAGMNALGRMAESPSDNVKNITNAILAKSAAFADLKAAIADGKRHKELDITNDIAKAIEKFSEIKADSKQTVELYLQQLPMFGSETTPFQNRILQVLDQFSRSSKAVRTILTNYIDAANALGDPSQVNLLGEKTTVSAEDVFRAAVEFYEEKNNAADNFGLFGEDTGRENEPGKRQENQESSGVELSPQEEEKQRLEKELKQTENFLQLAKNAKDGKKIAHFSQIKMSITSRLNKLVFFAEADGKPANQDDINFARKRANRELGRAKKNAGEYKRRGEFKFAQVILDEANIAYDEAIADLPRAGKSNFEIPADIARGVDKLLKEYEKVLPEFHDKIAEIAKALNLSNERVINLEAVKSKQRTAEKILADQKERIAGGEENPQPDYNSVWDVVRATLIVDDNAGLQKATDLIKENFALADVKNRFLDPTSEHYSDILFTVELPNGLKGEIQLHIPEMVAAKSAAHRHFEISRKLDEAADSRDLTDEEKDQREAAVKKQIQIYDLARRAFTNRTKMVFAEPDNVIGAVDLDEKAANYLDKNTPLPESITHDGITVKIDPMKKGLDARLKEIQDSTIRQVISDPQHWIDRYRNEIKDDGGNVIGSFDVNADHAKTLFPEYDIDPLANVAGVHEASSIIVQFVRDQILRELPKGSSVLLTAGGGGSGKGYIIENLLNQSDYGMIYDSVMKSVDGNERVIQKVIDSGHKPAVVAVFTPIETAAVQNLRRSTKPHVRRLVPLTALPGGHFGFQQSFIDKTSEQLLEAGYDPRFFVNDGETMPSEITLEKFRELVYSSIEEVTEKARQASYEELRENPKRLDYDTRTADALAGTPIAQIDTRRKSGDQRQNGQNIQGDNGRTAPGQSGNLRTGLSDEKSEVSDTAPPKDQPITLMFGGSFAPIHTDHANIALAARKYLEQQGYTVERLVLSPSADKLLKDKLGDDLVPLEHRAELARLTMQDLGFDVEVSDGAGVEAQNWDKEKKGKLKRTQLANWAKKQYPGTTVVNITGADQPVEGTPDEKTFPAVYTGAKGSSHDGFYYLSMPREVDSPNAKSSSMIRQSVKAGDGVPPGFMSPSAERYYLDYLKKKKPETKQLPAKKPADYGTKNTVFSKDDAEIARAVLRKKLKGLQHNVGIDPEIAQAGLQLAGYHIEAGARKFADYARNMRDDLGDAIKPYLKGFYMNVFYYPGFDNTGMDEDISKFDVEKILAENAEIADNREKDEKQDEPATSDEKPGDESDQNAAGDKSDLSLSVPAGDTAKSVSATAKGNDAELSGSDGDTRGVDALGPETSSGVGADDAPLKTDAELQNGLGQRAIDTGGESAPVGNRSGADLRDSVKDVGNFIITDELDFASFSPKQMFRKNIDAIRLVKTLEDENRAATYEEQKILAQFVGWGGLAPALTPGKKGWEREHAEITGLLTKEEFAAAQNSTINAHYTSRTIVSAMWDAVKQFGLKNGKILEPSVGSGNFFGLMPFSIAQNSALTAVELDPLTSAIAKHLYPKAKIHAAQGFQTVKIGENRFDLAIGNPPFDSQVISDDFNKDLKFNVHGFFFAKSIDALRPGGIMAMVVSRYWMDNNTNGRAAREYVADRARLVGAIRLPNDAFKSNANTEVVTDIIFLQKLDKGIESNKDEWLDGKQVLAIDEQTGEEIKVNKYFADHPEMILGDSNLQGKMTPQEIEYTVQSSGNLEEQIKEAIAKLPSDVYLETTSEAFIEAADNLKAAPVHLHPYSYHFDGGRLHQVFVADGEKFSQDVHDSYNEGQIKRLTITTQIRDAMREIYRLEQIPGTTDEELAPVRQKLNDVYDEFVKKFGYLSTDFNKRVFKSDISNFPLLLSLEKDFVRGITKAIAKRDGISERADSAKKSDIFFKRTVAPLDDSTTQITTPEDALLWSLNQFGNINAERMSEILDAPFDQIYAALGDLVYKVEGGYQTSGEFLSGDVKTKLEQVNKKLEESPNDRELLSQQSALEKVIPEDVAPHELTLRISEGWIPAATHQAFINHLFGENAKFGKRYSSAAGRWFGDITGASQNSNFDVWGTTKAPATWIIDQLFDGKRPVVMKTIPDPNDPSKTKRVVMVDETAAAEQKAVEIEREFSDWWKRDDERKTEIAALYNHLYNRIVNRVFDGKHLTLPGKISDAILKVHPHVKNAIFRSIQQGKALYNHVVGSGKTFTMIGTGMEMRRLGLMKKPLYVVPNHLIEQFAGEFVRLYPNANLLVASRKDFVKGKRQELFARIASGDWDGVIVAHSSFGFMKLPKKEEIAILEEQKNDLVFAIQEAKRDADKRVGLKELQKILNRVEEKINKLNNRPRDNFLNFAEMGIDGTFVDESHEFKNLFYTTQRQGIKGMGDPNGSGKAFDMFVKTQYILRNNNNRNVFFATGTPIANSLVEIYTVQRYLQYDLLKKQGIAALDAWLDTFGEEKLDFELNAAGRFVQKMRLSRIMKKPELQKFWNEIVDYVSTDDLIKNAEANGEKFPLPKFRRHRVIAKRSDLQAAYIGIGTPVLDEKGRKTYEKNGSLKETFEPGSIIGRLEHWIKNRDNGLIFTINGKTHVRAPGKEIPLAITNHARKAGLDYRLIDDTAPDHPGSKINLAVGNILKVYKEWEDRKGTQLVFCDLSVPKKHKGAATAAFAAKLPQFFIWRSDTAITHVQGVAVKLAALPGREFFSIKSGKLTSIVDKGSGARIATGFSKQAAIDDANNRLASNIANFEGKFTREAIPEELIENYIEDWQMQKEADEAAKAELEESDSETDDENAKTPAISEDELAADEGDSNFSVYDDVRQKLIKQGIPAAHIAFIHDYNTDLQKQELFAKMNRGDVRVLIGSTQKMGAGMNVQQQLVALHNLDSPYRPADMEQRVGRIVRQGNNFYKEDRDNFTVDIFDYATERTYDARMYELIEQKGKSFDQFYSVDGNREVDDISSETASYQGMKAESSGDKQILLSFKTDSEIKQLQAQERVFNEKKYLDAGLIKNFESGKTTVQRELADAQEMQRHNEKHPVESARLKFDTSEFSYADIFAEAPPSTADALKESGKFTKEEMAAAKASDKAAREETEDKKRKAEAGIKARVLKSAPNHDTKIADYRGGTLFAYVNKFDAASPIKIIYKIDGADISVSNFADSTNISIRPLLKKINERMDVSNLIASKTKAASEIKELYDAAKKRKDSVFPRKKELDELIKYYDKLVRAIRGGYKLKDEAAEREENRAISDFEGEGGQISKPAKSRPAETDDIDLSSFESEGGSILKLSRTKAAERAISEIEGADLSELLKVVDPASGIKQDGHRIDIKNVETFEIIRRAVEDYDLQKNPDQAERSRFDGVFLDPAQIKAVVKNLRKGADFGAKEAGLEINNRKKLHAIADAISGAAKIDGTVILSIFDDAISHEEIHRLGFIEAADKRLSERHGKNLENLAKHQTIDKLRNGAFSKLYPGASDAHVVEEANTWLLNGQREELNKLQRSMGLPEITQDEAADFLADWQISFHAANPNADMTKFAAVSEFAAQIYEQAQAKQTANQNSNGSNTANSGKNADGQSSRQSGNAQGIGKSGSESVQSPKSKAQSLETSSGREQKMRSLPETLREAGLSANDSLYDVFGNDEAKAKAQELLSSLGLNGAVKLLETSETFDKTNAVMSFMVQAALRDEAINAARSGDQKLSNELRIKALELADKHADLATKAGQFTQAAAMVAQSVDGVIYHAQKLAQKRGKKLSAKEISQLTKAGTDGEGIIAEISRLKAENKRLEQNIKNLKENKIRARSTAPRVNRAAIIHAKANLSFNVDDLISGLKAKIAKSVSTETILKMARQAQNVETSIDDDLAKIGASLLLDVPTSDIRRTEFIEQMRSLVGDKFNDRMPQIFGDAYALRNELLQAAKIELEREKLGQENPDLDADQVEALRLENQAKREKRAASGNLNKRLAHLYTPEKAKSIKNLIEIINENADSDIIADLATRILTKEIGANELSRKDKENFQAAEALLADAKIQSAQEKRVREKEILGDQKRLREIEIENFRQREAFKIVQNDLARQYRRLREGKIKYYSKEGMKILGESRSVLASGDLSGSLRQGFYFTVTDTGKIIKGNESWKSILNRNHGDVDETEREFLTGAYKAQFKSVLDINDSFAKVITAIEAHPMFDLMVKSGIEFAEAGQSAFSLTKAEENIRTEYAKKIPVLKSWLGFSERTYAGFLDQQRTLIADQVFTELAANGATWQTHEKEYKAAAYLINIATGRGQIGDRPRLQAAIDAFGEMFFAPSYMISRFQLLAHITGIDMAFQPPMMRRIALKKVARFHTLISLPMLALAAFGLAAVDPDDPDFLKVTPTEKSHYEFLGGLQPTLRFLGKLAKQAFLTASGKQDAVTMAKEDVRAMGRFFRGKLAPVPSLATDWFYQKDFKGDPFTWTGSKEKSYSDGAIASRITPIVVGDFFSAYNEDGAYGMMFILPAVLGVGTGYYEPRAVDPKYAARDEKKDRARRVLPGETSVDAAKAEIKAKVKSGELTTKQGAAMMKNLGKSDAVLTASGLHTADDADFAKLESFAKDLPATEKPEVRKVLMKKYNAKIKGKDLKTRNDAKRIKEIIDKYF